MAAPEGIVIDVDLDVVDVDVDNIRDVLAISDDESEDESVVITLETITIDDIEDEQEDCAVTEVTEAASETAPNQTKEKDEAVDTWCRKRFWETQPQPKDTKKKRVDVPSWAKVAVVLESAEGREESLKARRHAAEIFKLPQTPKNQQVAVWKTSLDALRKMSGPGIKLKRRAVDARKKASCYKRAWDELYEWLVETVRAGKRMSLRTMKRHAVRLAAQHGHDAAKIVARLRHFRKRYKVSVARAGRVRKETEEVQVAKCRMFHWFMHKVEEKFSPALSDIVNVDECPISPSGQMNPHSTVFTFSHESDPQLRNPHRAVTDSIADMKYRIGSFIPFVGKEMTAWQKNALLLFKGGTRDTREKLHYHRKVETAFNRTGVVSEEYMLKHFLPFWIALEGPRPRIRVLILDHHRAHITPAVEAAFVQARTVLAKIPKSMTSVLQTLDVHLFSRFRDVYEEILDAFLEKHPGLTASAGLVRKITNQCCGATLQRIVASYDFEARFSGLGYWRLDANAIRLRALQNYRYDPDWHPDHDTVRNTEQLLAQVSAAYDASVIRSLPGRQLDASEIAVVVPAKQLSIKDMFQIQTRRAASSQQSPDTVAVEPAPIPEAESVPPESVEQEASAEGLVPEGAGAAEAEPTAVAADASPAVAAADTAEAAEPAAAVSVPATGSGTSPVQKRDMWLAQATATQPTPKKRRVECAYCKAKGLPTGHYQKTCPQNKAK